MIPRALCIGDSIRIAYAPVVRADLAGQVEIVEPRGNGLDSRNVRRKVKGWVKRAAGKQGLDVIHFNCGLHDIKRRFGASSNQQSLDAYKENLGAIISTFEHVTTARLVWATTTPVIFQRHHEVKNFDRFEEDVGVYNQAAREIMEKHRIPVNDLHEIIVDAGVAGAISRDGVHMTGNGNLLLAGAVTRAILEACRR